MGGPGALAAAIVLASAVVYVLTRNELIGQIDLTLRHKPQVELDGAAGYMRRSDRIAVSLARRMPRAMRLAGQLTSRGSTPA